MKPKFLPFDPYDKLLRKNAPPTGLGLRQKGTYRSFSPGFTLVELLVVIFIIAILSAIGFAGYTKIRASANNAVSISNLRQLSILSKLYASDHNGQIMPPMISGQQTWDTKLSEYTDTKGSFKIRTAQPIKSGAKVLKSGLAIRVW